MPRRTIPFTPRSHGELTGDVQCKDAHGVKHAHIMCLALGERSSAFNKKRPFEQNIVLITANGAALLIL